MSRVIIFRDFDFKGPSATFYTNISNLIDYNWNDKISSFIIEDGSWIFYKHVNYEGSQSPLLPPGKYRSVTDIGIQNDSISSMRTFV